MWLINYVNVCHLCLKANPPSYDRTEDLASLLYLNESSIMHSLRQRYGGNLIHTYAGLNTVIINPLSTPSMYSEKVRPPALGVMGATVLLGIFRAVEAPYSRHILCTFFPLPPFPLSLGTFLVYSSVDRSFELIAWLLI